MKEILVIRMMDIERALKNIGDWISKETESRKYPKSELLELSESLQALKATIARQSVKSEEVAEAIEFMENELKILESFTSKYECFSKNISIFKTILTALQAYQPWVSVEDGLPESDDADEKGMVLTYDTFLNNETFPYDAIEEWNATKDNKITHWMPLPEPPKGE